MGRGILPLGSTGTTRDSARWVPLSPVTPPASTSARRRARSAGPRREDSRQNQPTASSTPVFGSQRGFEARERRFNRNHARLLRAPQNMKEIKETREFGHMAVLETAVETRSARTRIACEFRPQNPPLKKGPPTGTIEVPQLLCAFTRTRVKCARQSAGGESGNDWLPAGKPLSEQNQSRRRPSQPCL